MLRMLRTTPAESRGARGRRALWLTVAVPVALSLLTAGPAGATPLDDAKAKVTAAQHAADAATARYDEAQSQLAGIDSQIDTLRAGITARRLDAARLRAIARRRAVEAYKGRDIVVTGTFLVDGDLLDGIRREKLLQTTNDQDDATISDLDAVTSSLQQQSRDLERQRVEQQTVLAHVQAEQAQVQTQLGEAQHALNALEELLRKEAEAQRAREIAASIARAASSRANGKSYGGAYVATGIVCPVRGAVSFTDTWMAPRHQGPHMGVDIMAARGTPDVALVAGSVTFKSGGLSGNGAYLSGDDGNLYYYFHLDSFEGAPRRVAQGDVIGYVGNTGDASGGPTHTHFEIHPGHGAAVNPYPSVRAVC
jgi:murein DD-endopeptidase MepM/ murein hydrolase activator NlpD